MRVLQINVDDLGYGGVFSLVFNMQQHMIPEVVFDYCAVEKFQNTENIKRIEELGGSVYCLAYEGNKILRQAIHFYRLKRFLDKNKYPVVHIHSDVSFKLLEFSFAAKLAGVKSIIIHSHSAGIEGKHRKTKYIVHQLCKRLLKYTAGHYYACSREAANWMYCGDLKVKILKNGVDTNLYKFDKKKRDEIRDKLKLSDKFIVGNVGRFAYSKNHKRLLYIFKEILAMNSNSVLLLVGNGDLMEETVKIAHALNIFDSIVFYGNTTSVYDMLQALDVFVMPSRFEGLGIAAIEAQSVGIPVICSEGVPEAAIVNENAIRISLNCSDEYWAREILKLGEYGNCGNTRIKETGYDINGVSRELKEFYLHTGTKNDIHFKH